MNGIRFAQVGSLATAATVAIVLIFSGRTREVPPAATRETNAAVHQDPGLAPSPVLRSRGRDAERPEPIVVPGAGPKGAGATARPTAEDVPAAIKALGDPDESARGKAREALAAAGKDAVEPLLAAVRRDVDVGGGLSTFATAAIVAFDGLAEVGAPALARAIGDPGPRMSFWSVATFSRLGALRKDLHAAVPILQEHLREGAARTVQAAAEALGSIGGAAQVAVPDLARCLRSDEVQTRIEAASALGRIGPAASSALSDLRALESDASPTVRRVAAEATALVERR